jgi:hypothetical protein
MFKLEMLPAGCGDSLWLEYGEPGKTHIVLIDGGEKATAAELTRRMKAAMAERQVKTLFVDLLVITHYDNDHIDGILELLDRQELSISFGDIWFNGDQQLATLPPADTMGGEISSAEAGAEDVPADLLGDTAAGWAPADLLGAAEGDRLSALLRERGLPWNKAFNGKAAMIPGSGNLPQLTLPGDLKLTVLGPGLGNLKRLWKTWQKKVGTFDPAKLRQEVQGAADTLGRTDTWPPKWKEGQDKDPSPANGSSIALMAEYGGQNLLLTGDAHAADLVTGLDRLRQEHRLTDKLPLAAFKLPHHGSANNLSMELLQRLACNHYLISTDGSVYHHPDHQALLRILRQSPTRPLLSFNYKAETTRDWHDRQLEVLAQGFPEYDTEYPSQAGAGLKVELA